MASEQKPDHWTAQGYNAAANYVHKLSTKVVAYLDPQPGDKVLDIGCGDGPLTAQIAAVTVPGGGAVHGLDSSRNFIEHATATYAPQQADLTFELQDCSALGDWAAAHQAGYDKVFSNAALHWILRDPARRAPTLRAIHAALRPGGCFAFEMGGAGNVAEVHATLIMALIHVGGIPVDRARQASPWFFPSDALMRTLLEEAGFDVQVAELEYRPTKLETGDGGGIEGWVRLFGAQFLEQVPDLAKRDAVVHAVVQALMPTIIQRQEGGEYVGYVRCRGLAYKR